MVETNYHRAEHYETLGSFILEYDQPVMLEEVLRNVILCQRD